MMTQEKAGIEYQLSPEQRELVERFIAAFNSIHQELRRQLQVGKTVSFKEVVERYAKDYPSWRDREQLQAFRELRNFIAHEQTKPHYPLAVPMREAVETIEAIRDRLVERVIQRFKRRVETVKLTDTLAKVLELISEKKYSQFPVYNAKRQYQQLLTENGITYWLAHQAVHKSSPPHLEVVTVEMLLQYQEARDNCDFISRETSVPQAVNRFNQTPYLEALLITEHGGQDEPLLGIVTPWDLLQAEGKRK